MFRQLTGKRFLSQRKGRWFCRVFAAFLLLASAQTAMGGIWETGDWENGGWWVSEETSTGKLDEDNGTMEKHFEVWFFDKDGELVGHMEFDGNNPNPDGDGTDRGADKQQVVDALKEAAIKEKLEQAFVEEILLMDTPFGEAALVEVIDAVWNPGDESGPTITKPKVDLGLEQQQVDAVYNYAKFSQHFDPEGGTVGEQIVGYLKKGKSPSPDVEGVDSGKGPSKSDLQQNDVLFTDLGDPKPVNPPPPGVLK